MDIVDSEKELVLVAELPGLEKKDVEIAIEDGVLTLRGEKLEEKKENGAEKKYYLFERTFGSFNRTFTLPRFVDANKISAEFDKGVLKIHLPKTAELETKGRKIEIAVKYATRSSPSRGARHNAGSACHFRCDEPDLVERIAEETLSHVGILHQLRRSPFGENDSVGEDVRSVAQRERLANVVVGEQHADAALAQPDEHLMQRLDR
jgi:HSP20 family molecular chaperone IbpA